MAWKKKLSFWNEFFSQQRTILGAGVSCLLGNFDQKLWSWKTCVFFLTVIAIVTAITVTSKNASAIKMREKERAKNRQQQKIVEQLDALEDENYTEISDELSGQFNIFLVIFEKNLQFLELFQDRVHNIVRTISISEILEHQQRLKEPSPTQPTTTMTIENTTAVVTGQTSQTTDFELSDYVECFSLNDNLTSIECWIK